MFGDDFFGGGIEDLFNKLAGGSFGSHPVRSRNNNNVLSVTGNNKKKYFVFDLSGHKLNSVEIKDDLEVNNFGEEVNRGVKVLEIRFDGGSIMKYELPKELRRRNMNYTFKNGILEVVLEK
jgi:hypothetical protein